MRFFPNNCVISALCIASLLTLFSSRDSLAFSPCKTKIMTVKTPAQTLTVNLNGARDLYLYADYAGDSYDCDQAIWGEPTLIDQNGASVDLTAIKPESAQTGWGNLIVGKNHVGESLHIGQQTFSTGFWAHAPSLLHFKLDKPYESFTVQVGLDPHASRGSVVFEIRDQPIKLPEPSEYQFTNASTKLPPVPSVSKTEFQFDPSGAKQLLSAGVDKLVFVRRHTYNSNHVYTDHVNCDWLPGAGFCVLDLKTGEVRDLLYEELHKGMIQRFDISFDAQKIVFDFKASPKDGYRIYEANLDGSNLHQLTFPVEDEAELVKKYKNGNYLHGTDDLHPCYLPDGGIAFVSTRPQFSVLCDSSDTFTVTNLFRMDSDGSNLKALTYSALNEQSPAILPDGRIIYHRWEYVDKAAGNAKALWAINPDGTGASEVYGDNISFPESMMYPRPIPDSDNKIVFLGTSHCCPNNAFGTIIEIDAKKDARSIETMRYITDDVRTYHHNGFHFRDENGDYKHDLTGIPGRLFKDPYPIAEDLIIASRKPKGLEWSTPNGYDLVVLNENGEETLLFSDENASCWHPMPIWEREVPPVRSNVLDQQLADKNLALCTVTNIYAGMPNVPKGSVKFIRVLEQVPRSWSARKSWGEDHEGTTHAHSAVSNGSLSIKLQLGVIPVEEDGSASFYVPANRAIYFQALDAQYRSIQTERTYVNYKPGEQRACVGCHETQSDAPSASNVATPIALTKDPVFMQAQADQSDAEFSFDYDRQIQPIWDARCISCHNGAEGSPTPDMRGTPKGNYSVSYWNLVNLGNTNVQLLGNRATRNEDAASNGIEFIPSYQTGTLSSPLGMWLFGENRLNDAPQQVQDELQKLFEVHAEANVQLSEQEKLLVANWLDVNVPYHPSYFGRLHEKFKERLDYRPSITAEESRSRTLPQRIQKLYDAADKQTQP